jgi:hypothetical protein
MLHIVLKLYCCHWRFVLCPFTSQDNPGFSSAQRVDEGQVYGRYFLASHPQAMVKLEAELDAAGLLVTEERPQPRAFTFADISRLHYMDYVVKVARKFAPVLLHWRPVSCLLSVCGLHLDGVFAGRVT